MNLQQEAKAQRSKNSKTERRHTFLQHRKSEELLLASKAVNEISGLLQKEGIKKDLQVQDLKETERVMRKLNVDKDITDTVGSKHMRRSQSILMNGIKQKRRMRSPLLMNLKK